MSDASKSKNWRLRGIYFIDPWNHCTSTVHRSETMGQLQERQSGLRWNAKVICEVSKTSWQMGKHLVKGGSVSKSLARHIPRICIVRGRNVERRHIWLQKLRSWRIWTRQEFILEEETQKKCWRHKRCKHFTFPVADVTAKLSGGDLGVREPTLSRDQSVRNEDLTEDLQGNSEKSQPIDEMTDGGQTPSRVADGTVKISQPTSSSSSPTATSSDNDTRVGEDRTENDTSPVPMSTNVDVGTGQPVVDQANPNLSKTNKNEDHELERRDLLCSDILEWPQEFRENLVDDRVLVFRLEPTSTRSVDLGKHIVYTHFREKIAKLILFHFELIFAPPVCQSLRLDAHLEEHVSSDMLRRRRSPARSQRKEVRKDQLHYWRILHNWFVYLKILVREKSSLRGKGKLGSKRAVNVSKGTWHQIKIREREGGFIQKCEPHERSPCAPKFGEISHEEALHQERCARRVAWDLAKKYLQAQEFGQSYVFCWKSENS